MIDKEVDLLDEIKFIWAKRRTLVVITIVFMVLGLVVAFGSSEAYVSEAVVLPEANRSSTSAGIAGQLGGLANLAGIDVGGLSGPDAFSPELYPTIASSLPFLIDLSNFPVTSVYAEKKVPLSEYYRDLYKPSVLSRIKKYTFGMPAILIGWAKGEEEVAESLGNGSNDGNTKEDIIITVNRAEERFLKSLLGKVNIQYDQRSKLIRISSEFPEPQMSAEVTQFAMQYIVDYLKEYRIRKLRDNYEFINSNYERAKERTENAQASLAAFRDKNINISTASSRMREERLLAEYNLANNVYNALANQREQANIKLQEETPVFLVLNPPQVPNYRSKPKKPLILVGFTLLGIVSGLFYIIIKRYNGAYSA